MGGNKLNWRGNDEERFFRNVEKTETCWIWTAYKDKDGYGNLMINQYPHKAHRFSYTFHKGEIPKGLCILHTCDNPACVNPEHLWAGSVKDNNKDRAQKGRSGDTSGDKCYAAKLDWDRITEIRKKYNIDGFSQKELAREFNVSPACISKIIQNKSWSI